MGIRSSWTGMLSLGLIPVPVKLYKATEEKDVTFHQLHEECGTQIRMKKYCPACVVDLQGSDIVKGFPLGDVNIPLTEEDLAQIPLDTLRKIDIVSVGELPDPLRLDKNYFMQPDKGAEQIFSVILGALATKEKKSLLGLISIRNRERPCAIWIREDTIVLSTLKLDDEVRHIPFEIDKNISKEELELSTKILDLTHKDVEPDYDRYRKAVIELAMKKANGETITSLIKEVAAPKEDLMETLRRTVAAMSNSGDSTN